MEPEQFISDDLNLSPYSNQGFQADRFIKRTNNLNIPDTIQENCSAELSGECLKKEVPKVIIDAFICDDQKENISNNQEVISNESLNISANLAIDNSYIRRCERKLLESSYSDEEKNFEIDFKSSVSRPLLEIQKQSGLHNETISTPPSLLRKEISMLRNEMAEAHEFHDFEIKLLQEEKSTDIVESEKYIELFEKYSALVELYSNLKTEFDECRKNQENMRNELQSKTADYLESLCSQIETSDNSLNFSSSFVSFGGGLKSSTMMEGVSELEATVLNDERTVLADDPLSITGENDNCAFKTPMQTPLRSTKKLFTQELSSSAKKKTIRETEDVTARGDAMISLDSEYNIQLLNLETAFYDKVKEVEDLEQRLFKVEDMALVLHSEFERITSVYAKENEALKENLFVKTEQMNELTQKLFTETISLDPSLRDSLLDISGMKLLGIFIETIMENCRKIRNHDQTSTIENLRNQLSSQEIKLTELEELRAKLSDAETTILVRDEEIKMLQAHASNVRQTREELASAKEVVSELDAKLKVVEAEKTAAESRCLDLETLRENLLLEMEAVKSQLSVVSDRKVEIENESARLKDSFEDVKAQLTEMEAILKSNETEMITLKENLLRADATIQQLKSQLKSITDEKSELDKQYQQLQETNQSLQRKIAEVKNLENNPAYEEVRTENESLKERIFESEKLMSELKNELETARKHKISEVEELVREIEKVKKESSDFLRAFENIEKVQKDLGEALLDIDTDRDLPSDRIKLILNSSTLQDTFEGREGKIISVFAETITKACKEVQNELIKNFDREKEEWEAERDCDLNKIKGLEEEIKLLRKKGEQNETEIREIVSQKTDLIKSHEDLKKQLTETEKVISACQDEIQTLKSRECYIKKTEDDLSAANQIIEQFKAQLDSMKTEKIEKEQHCCELEESISRLQTQNSASIKELDETKTVKVKLENEIDNLRQQILESEKVVLHLQKIVDDARKEQADRELRIRDLETEIDLLKKDAEKSSGRLENLEISNKSLRGVLSDVQSHLDIPENILTELLSGNLDNNKILSERINNLIKAQLKDSKEEQTDQGALGELRKAFQSLEVQLSEAQDIISAKEEEMRLFQINIKETQDEFACTKAALSRLESQMETAESERKEVQNRYRDLETVNENLKREIESRENLQKELENKLLKAREKLELENDLKESYDSLKTQMTEVENTVSKRDEEIRILKSKESSMENQIEELRQTCEDLKSKLSETDSVISVMSTREKQIEALLSDISSAREDLASVKEDLDSKLKAIEAEKTAAENRCRDLETASENLKREIAESQNLGKELQTQLSLALEEKSHAEDENAHLKELYDALKVRTVEAENSISQRDDEIRLLKSNENQLEELKLTCENLKAKLFESEDTISSQKEQIGILLSDNERTQGEISTLKTGLLELETQLTAEKTRAEKQRRELEEVIESLKKEIDNKENLGIELKTQKSEIETENIQLKQSYDTLKAQMTEAENTIFNRNQEIRALKSYESQFTAIKENLVSADETILKLKSQLKSIENEKSEMESRCSELQESNQNLRVEINSAKNLENNPAYEKIQNENDGLKRRVFEYEKMVADLKSELDGAKENQRNNIFKVEELIREVEELKKENNGFSLALGAIEETQKNLADVLSDAQNDSDLPGDRITKVIAKTSKAPESVDTRETKIVSDFVETISKTCKGVQNELIKKFDSKKLEWETQRDVDLQNLRDKIEILTEKNVQQEAVLKQVKEQLAETDEVIQQLKSELSSAHEEKVEVEYRCRKLEEGMLSLQSEVDTKETILRGLDELKIVREKLESENNDLKRQIVESEEVVIRLKQSLKVVQDEQSDRELRIKEFESEISLLKKEKESLTGLAGTLKNLEKNHAILMDVLSDVQNHLNLPEDTLTKLLSEDFKNKRIFIERVNSAITTQMDGLKVENKNLKLGNDCLKERVRQLTEIIEETPEGEGIQDPSNLSTFQPHGMNLRSKSGKKADRYERRLDKLEEINHNLTEMLIRILTMLEFPDLEKLNLGSVGAFPKTMKKVRAHVNTFLSTIKELKEDNGQLDEECETYSNIIKDLKKEAAAVWKANTEKTRALEAEIDRLKEEKNSLENDKQELLVKISKLDADSQKLQNAKKTEGLAHGCPCGNDSKKINELKRTILVKEQKLLELQDLEAQASSLRSQIEYLKTALEREKKKAAEEKEKNKKLQNQLNEATRNEKTEKKKSEENQVLEELRMRGSISGGIVQEFGDKEKMRKLSKDIGILKELCRARYAEIKRLEAVNAALRNAAPKHPATPKNSNQMDSPIRSRGVSSRSKNQVRDVWKSEIVGKENGL